MYSWTASLSSCIRDSQEMNNNSLMNFPKNPRAYIDHVQPKADVIVKPEAAILRVIKCSTVAMGKVRKVSRP